MITRYTFLTTSFLLLRFVSCYGQDAKIYEIPFSIEKKLLVFKGQLNGVETNFAFDTGAAEGIATTINEKSKGVERKTSTQRISDGNGKVAYLQTAITKKLSIGGFTFENVRASITDMQYLYCMDLYLLGADIIRKLNWEIDFKKMILKVSKNNFETNKSMTIIPVKYKYNTPRIKISINNINFDNVLIDFGYNGVMTIPNTDKKIKSFLEKKKQQHLITSKISSSFAAMGMSKPSLTESTLIDSFKINDHYYQQVPAEFMTNTDFKIGLSFFSSICEKVIINNNEKKYYLQLKTKSDFKNSFPVAVLLKDGKLKISSATVNDNPTENIFTIDEEIKSINGKTANDFKSECEFLNWYYITRWESLIIEKINGQKIETKRSQNP